MIRKFLRTYLVFSVSSVFLVTGLVFLLFGEKNLANYIFLASILLGGTPLVFSEIRSFLKGNWGVDIIAALAIITSFLLGEYFAGAIIVIMLSGGEALEDFALKNASKALEELARRAPTIAHRLKGKEIEDVKVDKVKKDDILLVKPGELIPVDGVIVEGESSFNESALTGESVPVDKVHNSAVLSGSVNLVAPIKIRAIRSAKESKYEQIVELVKKAQKTKAPIHRLADRYGAFFTPLTLIIVAATFFLTHNWVNVLAVLVVATPCPLILATPIAIMGGINKAAKSGIIVKNGGALEEVGNTKALVFDKTGTLTFGIPKIVALKSFANFSEEEILFFAASVERLSAHILAKATLTAALERKINLSFPENFEERFGKGVAGIINKKEVVFGSVRFLEEHAVVFEEKFKKLKEEENSQGRMSSFLAVDGEVVGAVIYGDEVRPEIREFINHLRKEEKIERIAMLTGDSEQVAEEVAARTGIDDVVAQSLPEDKVKFINKLKKKYKNVVMVGDGFNDAPALASATVGIALGAGGSSVSSESADIVLVVDNLIKIQDIIHIGKKVLSVAKGGIFFGMGASVVAMLFASQGLIPPAVGAVLQEGIDVVVIINALRTSR